MGKDFKNKDFKNKDSKNKDSKKSAKKRSKSEGEGRPDGGSRLSALEERLAARIESRLAAERERDRELWAALRASRAALPSSSELAARLEEARQRIVREVAAELEDRWRGERERLAQRIDELTRSGAVPPAPPLEELRAELADSVERRLRSSREQDLRHREALFARFSRWIGLPLAVALIVLAGAGIKALADLRAIARAVGMQRAAQPEEPRAAEANEPAAVDARPPDSETPAQRRAASLARLRPSDPGLEDSLYEALERCSSLDDFGPLLALAEALADPPPSEAPADERARAAHLERLAERMLREPFRLVARPSVEGGGLTVVLAERGRPEEPEALALEHLWDRPPFRAALSALLRRAAAEPSLARMRARVDQLTMPDDDGRRAFAVLARLAPGAALHLRDGAGIDGPALAEISVRAGPAGAPLVARSVELGADEAWRALELVAEPERVTFDLAPAGGGR